MCGAPLYLHIHGIIKQNSRIIKTFCTSCFVKREDEELYGLIKLFPTCVACRESLAVLKKSSCQDNDDDNKFTRNYLLHTRNYYSGMIVG